MSEFYDTTAVAALADIGGREIAARKIAQSLGAETLIVFIQDPTLGILLPALGFTQTLPARTWQAFLARAAECEIAEMLPFPDQHTIQSVMSLRGSDGTVLALIGASMLTTYQAQALRALLPLLGALYKNELITNTMQRQLDLAQSSAANAQALANRLDRARAELERAIRTLTQTEDALTKEKEQLAVTLESIGDGVITCDLEGRIVSMNRVAQALTGWPLANAQGRALDQVFNIVDEHTRIAHENPVVKVLKTGEVVELANHTVLIARDGTQRAIDDSGAPIRDRNGRILGVVLVFRDITDKKKAEAELIKAQRLESIGLLAGGIAHDFNNILTALFGNIALAKMRAYGNHDVVEVLDEAEGAFRHARDLSHQLLTFAKGGAPIKKTANIVDLIQEAATFILRGANIYCEYRFDAELWPVSCDVGQMSQVFNNLLINAKDAMSGGGKVVISGENIVLHEGAVGMLAEGPYVHIAVHDHGGGIDKLVLPKIFDPYFSTKKQGSGLGLTTTYSIIKRHDGHVAVESQPHRGTTFHIYLPAATVAPLITSQCAETSLRGEGSILLMDDEASVRKVGHALLATLGYEVTCVEDGAEALQRYREALHAGKRYAVVVLDLTVPRGMGGEECIAALKEIDNDVCAVVSSGHADHPVMADYKRHGFCGVLKKPYILKELGETLQRFTNEHSPNKNPANAEPWRGS